MGLGVILDHTQAGLLLVHDRDFHSVAGDDGCGIDFIGFDIAGRRCDLLDAVSARLNLGENSSTGIIGFSGIYGTGLNVLDSNRGTGQLHTGVGVLLHH